MPEGWKRIEQGQLVVLAPPDITDREKFIIVILPGQELKGDFRKTFEETTRRGVGENEQIVQESEIQSQRGANGLDILTRLMVIENRDGSNRTTRLYLAAHPGDRFEMLAIVVNDPSLFERYKAGMVEFLNSWTFANLREKAAVKPKAGAASKPAKKPAAPKAKPAASGQAGASSTSRRATSTELEGLYYGEELRNQLNFLSNTYQYIRVKRYYLFLPGGRVYYGIPKEGGITRVSFERLLQSDPDNCGYYRIAGGKISFDWQGKSKDQTFDFARRPNGLRIGRFNLSRMSVPDGYRLDGSYSFQTFANVSATFGSQGGVSGQTTITFDRNGRFTEEGFVGATVVYDGPAQGSGPREPGTIAPPPAAGAVGATTSGKSGGSGVYRIRNNLLELIYADGRRRRVTFLLFPGDANKPQPSIIMIDGITYLRR